MERQEEVKVKDGIPATSVSPYESLQELDSLEKDNHPSNHDDDGSWRSSMPPYVVANPDSLQDTSIGTGKKKKRGEERREKEMMDRGETEEVKRKKTKKKKSGKENRVNLWEKSLSSSSEEDVSGTASTVDSSLHPNSEDDPDINILPQQLSSASVNAVESVGNGTEESENEEVVKEDWNSDEGISPVQNQFWNYGQENYGKYGMIRNRSSSMDNEEILWDMKASELKLPLTPQDPLSLPNPTEKTETPNYEEHQVHSFNKVKSLSTGMLNGGNLSERTREPIFTGISVKALKSSFTKGDTGGEIARRIIRTRIDRDKVAQKFNQTTDEGCGSQECWGCGKQVFQMEQVKAAKGVFHKNCLRCRECQKVLTVDTYCSHEGEIYCKPHFKQLFQPKAVIVDSHDPVPIEPELIIRENEPVDLPADVVRSSQKMDYGLEELANLADVRSKFLAFEQLKNDEEDVHVENVSVKRSPSILNRIAKFQGGEKVGIPDEELNGKLQDDDAEQNESESENDDDADADADADADGVIRSRKHIKEEYTFHGLNEIRSKWESPHVDKKEMSHEKRREEQAKFRQLICRGKSGNVKALYENILQDQDGKDKPTCPKEEILMEGEGIAQSIREKFEKGLIDEEKELRKSELIVFSESEVSRGARSLFRELDASLAKSPEQQSPKKAKTESRWSKEISSPLMSPPVMDEVARASDQVDDVSVETSDISARFKFFETYKEPDKKQREFRITPPRDGDEARDPSPELHAPKMDDKEKDFVELVHSDTTRKMLSKFRELEQRAQLEEKPEGPKPLKCITPPPDYTETSSESEDEEEDEDEEEESEEELDEFEDEALRHAKGLKQAKSLREKFEHWEDTVEKNNQLNLLETDLPSIDTTRNLRAKFECLQVESQKPIEKPKPKVNRFI